MIVYDIPYRTGVRIERETLRRIVRHPRIAAVKDCGGDSETTMALIEDGHAQVLAGEDLQIFNNLCLGGAGAISASAHVRADLYVRMVQQVDSGDWAAARGTFYQLLPWIKVAFAEPNPAVVKAALQLQSLIADELREPMQACTNTTETSCKACCVRSAPEAATVDGGLTSRHTLGRFGVGGCLASGFLPATR